MRTHIATLGLIALLAFPSSALALSKRNFGATRTRTRASTAGMFLDKQVWLPGSWTVTEKPEELLFRKSVNSRSIEVRISLMPKQDCTYGPVRMRALKAWGGKSLNQNQARIENLGLGTLKYRGYTWVEPSTWAGDRRWCIGQDPATAAVIIAPEGDTELTKFIRNDLLLQIASRQGRSVLPWPAASEHSSSSK